MRTSIEQKRQAGIRSKRWNREEIPYFRECLFCRLMCDQVFASKGNIYNILNCPKKHTGEAFFPYALKKMKKEVEYPGSGSRNDEKEN